MQDATSQYYFGLVQNCDNLLILCRMRPAAPCYGQRPSACRAMCFLPTDSRVPDGSACAPARRLARHGAGPVVGRCEHAATPDLPAAHTDGRQRRLLLDLPALQRACCACMVSMCSLFDEAQCPRNSTDTPQPRLRHRRPAACRRGPARDGERGGGRADVRDGAPGAAGRQRGHRHARADVRAGRHRGRARAARAAAARLRGPQGRAPPCLRNPSEARWMRSDLFAIARPGALPVAVGVRRRPLQSRPPAADAGRGSAASGTSV